MRSKETLFLFSIVLLAFIFRMFLINQSLWLDEAIGAEAVKNFSFKGILTEFITNDNHPPLYYLVLKFWTGIFGYSEMSIRMPSIIFGLLTIYVTFLISKVYIFGKQNIYRFVPSLFLATSQLHIYYSQEARMYSMAAFLASLVVYSFLYIIGNSFHLKSWLLFSFSLTLLIFTDYLPGFMIPPLWLWGIIAKKNLKWWLNFMASHLPIALLGLVWLPTFIVQSQHGRWLLENFSGWKEVAGGANIKQVALLWIKFSLGRISLGDKVIYYSIILFISVPFIWALKNSYINRKKVNFVWILLIFPPLLVYIASFLFPAFNYFRLLFILPVFYILIAHGISSFNTRSYSKIMFASIFAVNIFSLAVYITDVKQQREDWRRATKFVENKAKKDEIVIFDYPEPFTPYRWYADKAIGYGATDGISANKGATYHKTEDLIESKTGLYHFEYLRDLSDPNRYVEEALIMKNFRKQEVFNFVGVGQVSYWTK